MDTYIGFDSAWTDNPNRRGAICALLMEGRRPVEFRKPELAGFDEAIDFIRSVCAENGVTLIALDQPTIVPNSVGMRTVERVAASLISWLGGGVQPSNRKPNGLFSDSAPIWRFLTNLQAVQDPEKARNAEGGIYLMEVFPALALPSFCEEFCRQGGAPKYNPDNRKKFRKDDWMQVAQCATVKSREFCCDEVADWCDRAAQLDSPRKCNQDKLDAVLCLLIALHWRLRDRTESLFLGDLESGYMVSPATPTVRQRLLRAAIKLSVPMDREL